jgi:hypothetical protein
MTSPVAIGPFAATVDAVYNLAPEAERVTDGNLSKLPTPITEDTVARWVEEVSAAVSVGIGPWASFTGPTLERVSAAARAVVANGAASYLEAARYPTRADLNDSTYAGVLWRRYTDGVATLAGQVTALIDAGGPDVIIFTGRAGPFGVFPEPYFVDGDPWSPPALLCGDPRAAW